MTFPTFHDDLMRTELLKAQRIESDAWQQRLRAVNTMEELATLVIGRFKNWYFDRPDATRFETRILVDWSIRMRIAPQDNDGPDLFPGALIAALQELTSWEVFQGNSRLNTSVGVRYDFIIREPQAS